MQPMGNGRLDRHLLLARVGWIPWIGRAFGNSGNDDRKRFARRNPSELEFYARSLFPWRLLSNRGIHVASGDKARATTPSTTHLGLRSSALYVQNWMYGSGGQYAIAVSHNSFRGM